MRYLLLTFYRKADGKLDEVMTVTKSLKLRDHQTANVILDFKTLSVVKCLIEGNPLNKDWDTIVSYYYQFYANIIERLFNENGYQVEPPKDPVPADTEQT